MTSFFMNTVLLEKNRWEEGQNPSIAVSDWLPKLRTDGFDGIELWENHSLKASEPEIQLLKHSSIPVEVYNSYVSFEDGFEQQRAQAANMVNRLRANKIKFNFGKDPERLDEYIQNFQDWKEQLPNQCTFLCECHPGTVMEDPKIAKGVFKRIGSNDIGAMIHPFHKGTDVKSWFKHLGEKVVYAHVSLFDGSRFHLLERYPEFVESRIQVLKENGFNGDFSLEFTEGTALENEKTEQLYHNAIRDISFLKVRWKSLAKET
ncbi:sugar phosphate isomerase/epimerase family protein [Pontibacillus marinus]|uniref:Xylose isomerase-like TIM barrel domain-containing protein n=1 Tax=Pontibacillus marinus BH030004 = DSM 16465 TaxID=1385511 RepID=A0A0A5GH35_9BACI|nr:sugar phosphate isomerase/epimerase [Pontibacillus marinus]KGX90498.1 hypothetical protein N783_16820 [Pontibacillus marinus BH030004 = DSM 16465]